MNHPFFVTAADEALAISCYEFNTPNTLHFYRRHPPAISVGYFRKVEDDVDVEKCKDLGIEIVRRTSGGGSIYTDKHQLIFSTVTNHALGRDVEDSFRQTCTCLIDALDTCGIKASFKPPNDVLINGKKVSGSAQVKKKRAYVTHTTLILKLDQDTIEQVLKQPKHGYVSSIQNQCGFVPELSNLKSAIKSAFEQKFEIKFKPDKISVLENNLIQELIKTKYGNAKWNFKR